MLAPIGMMVLVDQISARASEYVVSATVPAPLPTDKPVITSPQNGAVVHSQTVIINGTCAVVTPAIVIAIYEGDVLLGSTACGPGGTFTIPVTFTPGTHTIQAKVITITGQVGAVSDDVVITYQLPATPSTGSQGHQQNRIGDVAGIGLPVRIIPSSPYAVISPTGQVTWQGTIRDGSLPYAVTVDWGDGQTSTYKVGDNLEQSFSHQYSNITTYTIIIKVTDAYGDMATLYSVAVTYRTQQNLGLGVDGHLPSTSPFVSFIERYIWHIYIITLSSLVFLWYIEHGRHLRLQSIPITKKSSHKQKRR